MENFEKTPIEPIAERRSPDEFNSEDFTKLSFLEKVEFQGKWFDDMTLWIKQNPEEVETERQKEKEFSTSNRNILKSEFDT